MKVIVAGSRQLPKGLAPRLLIRFLSRLDEKAIVLLRRGISTRPGPFEQDVAHICEIIHQPYEWRIPQPDEHVKGRATVFVRDIDMVSESDLVLAFFTAEEAMDDGGTTHLVEKAVDAGVPVYAFAFEPHGRVDRVGEYDPDDQWRSLIEG